MAFADNYWRADFDPLDFDGESVIVAHNRELNEDILSLSGAYTFEHSDTHLWYHGTIDTTDPISDGSINTFYPQTRGWHSGSMPPRTSGYSYSHVVGGPRPSDGIAAALGGTGQRQTVGGITTSTPWCNVINLNLTTFSRYFAPGTPIPVSYWYEDIYNDSTITFYLDSNHNPYDDTGVETDDPVPKLSTQSGATFAQQNISTEFTSRRTMDCFSLFMLSDIRQA